MECPNKQDLLHHYRENEKISPTSVKKIKFFSHGRAIPSYRVGYQFSELEPLKKKQGPPDYKLNCSLIDSGFKLRSLQQSDKCHNLPKGTLEVLMEKLTLQKRIFVIEFSTMKSALPVIEATQNTFDFWVRTSIDDDWRMWDQHHRSLKRSLAVKLAIDLTSNKAEQNLIQKLIRWLAEPIDAVFLSTDQISTQVDAKAFEILDQKFSPVFIAEFDDHKLVNQIPNLWKDLIESWNQRLDSSEKVAREWIRKTKDRIFEPLQPLCNNLSDADYGFLELCPVKYHKYRQAIELAMKTKLEQKNYETIVVMILGAGRGPLVRKTLEVLNSWDPHIAKLVTVCALDKNPLAVDRLKINFANTNVKVFHCDMRKWIPTHRADVIISELLGSFGDNELSPECLEATRTNVAKDDCFFLPAEYSSYISPLFSHVMYNIVSVSNKYETPVVANLNRFALLESPQLSWTFSHEKPETNFERYTRHSFSCNSQGILHGFAGYFTARLFGQISLSITPGKDEDQWMLAWFPMYFPLKSPIYVSKDDQIEMEIWRKTTEEAVWYEWKLSSPKDDCNYNFNGHSFQMRK